MKGIPLSKIFKAVLFCTVLIMSTPLLAQEEFSAAESDYYRVLAQGSDSDAQELADSLDAYARLFEEFLHFDRAALPSRLKVRIFASQDEYTAYLQSTVGTPRDSFVFLQYSDPTMSELVGYMNGSDFDRSLVHHAFIQYLKSFVHFPPLWLQKGMAIYLENSRYNPASNTAEYRENLSWLKSLKTYIALETEIIPVSLLLTMDVESANRQIESFYAQSWGLVHFLLNSQDKRYNRIIWDALSALRTESTREENESAVIDKGFAWVNKEEFLNSFSSYMDNLKTFPELVQQGIALYSQGDYAEAEKSFTRALDLKKSHYIPYYYLGLIKYSEQDYAMSDYYYSQALDRNGAPGLIYYARGITAYSAEDISSARDYLDMVLNEDPAEYGGKAQELLERIDSEESGAPASPESPASSDSADSAE